MKLAPVAATLLAASAVTTLAAAQDAPPPPPMEPPPAAAPMAPAAPPPPPSAAMAPAEPPPSKGTGLLIGGGIVAGLGAINLATSIPICHSNLYGTLTSDQQDTCAMAAMIVSGAVTAVGVTMLIVGGAKRSAYNDWKAEHPLASGFAPRTFAKGGGLGWSASF